MAYEKALSLITGGGGSGATVFPIVYEGSNGYVEVEETELLAALKSGIVIFREASEENGELTGVTDYYVMNAYSGTVTSVFLFNNNATVASWNYNNGRYEGPSY